MKKLPLIGLALALVVFLAGVVHLFKLRFDAGDTYPPYSSFRTDPLGAKALYASIDALRPARRGLEPLTKLGDGRDTTLLWLGEAADDLKFTPVDYKALDTFVRSGGRLVISLQPTFRAARTNVFVARAARRGATNAPPAGRGRRGLEEDPRTELLSAKWGYGTKVRDLARKQNGEYQAETATLQDAPASPALPATLKIWTALGFTTPTTNSAWRTIYTRGSGTGTVDVLIERDLGRGTVVLSADSYYFSNEALRDDREAGLLTWFAGPARQVIFEETHLGVSESPGIATLARKYGLQLFSGALLVLALLFIWKNSAPFMPPHEQHRAADDGEFVAGKDSNAGFVNLLRRHIAPGHLMRVCLEQWNAHVARTRKPSREQLEAMQQIIDAENALDPRQRNPVGTYRTFASLLARRSGTRGASFVLPKPDSHSHSPETQRTRS